MTKLEYYRYDPDVRLRTLAQAAEDAAKSANLADSLPVGQIDIELAISELRRQA